MCSSLCMCLGVSILVDRRAPPQHGPPQVYLPCSLPERTFPRCLSPLHGCCCALEQRCVAASMCLLVRKGRLSRMLASQLHLRSFTFSFHSPFDDSSSLSLVRMFCTRACCLVSWMVLSPSRCISPYCLLPLPSSLLSLLPAQSPHHPRPLHERVAQQGRHGQCRRFCFPSRRLTRHTCTKPCTRAHRNSYGADNHRYSRPVMLACVFV